MKEQFEEWRGVAPGVWGTVGSGELSSAEVWNRE